MTTLRLFVYCTDKGQHQRARLGELNLFDSEWMAVGGTSEPTYRGHRHEWVGGSNILSQHANPVPDDAVGVRIESIAVPLSVTPAGCIVRVVIDCPRCPRHIEWREETAREVITHMCADSPLKGDTLPWRAAWLDISHVP